MMMLRRFQKKMMTLKKFQKKVMMLTKFQSKVIISYYVINKENQLKQQ
jgi:hypothetical protein